MCHAACIKFGTESLRTEDIRGKRVIDVGSCNVNGSLRASIEGLGPSQYVGVDISEGPGVDRVCRAEELVAKFGPQSFDAVISTEMLEHVRDWRGVVSNLKNVLKPGGVLLLTTRSYGFPYHGYPFDFWRFELDDMKAIFADMIIDKLENDWQRPGVFLRAIRPEHFAQTNVTDYRLYSVVSKARCRDITDSELRLFNAKFAFRRMISRAVPEAVKARLRGVVRFDGLTRN